MVDDDFSSLSTLQDSKFIWNLLSHESDKILNISRDNFLLKPLNELHKKFVTKILPEALKLSLKLLENKKTNILSIYKDKLNILANMYFKVLNTCIINNVEIQEVDKEFLNQEEIQKKSISKVDETALKMSDFFNVDKFIIPKITGPLPANTDNFSAQKNLLSKSLENNQGQFIIWESGLLSLNLLFTYQIYKIEYFNDGAILYFEKDNFKKNGIEVKIGDQLYLKEFIPQDYSNRLWNYASNKYSKKIFVKRKTPNYIDVLPPYNNQFIISPFYHYSDFNVFKSRVRNLGGYPINDATEQLITNELISEFITPWLIDWIIGNGIEGEQQVTKAEIIEGYRALMVDILKSISE